MLHAVRHGACTGAHGQPIERQIAVGALCDFVKLGMMRHLIHRMQFTGSSSSEREREKHACTNHDYITDHSDPEPYLRALAEASFTHVHWCHQWRSDFLYADSEIAQIGRWLHKLGSQAERRARLGRHREVLVQHQRILPGWPGSNWSRIASTWRSSWAATMVMHVYPPTVQPKLSGFNDFLFDQIRRSLDEISKCIRVNAGCASPSKI